MLHRLVMNAKPGEIVDHKDHNPRNNRKSNLALGTQSENLHNKKSRGTSRFKGVWYRKDRNCFAASISVNDRTRHLGRFKTEEDAARAYNEAAIEIYGDRAVLNEVPPPPAQV